MSEMVRQTSLQQLETIIERGVKTFVEVGLALMEVRDRRLYKEAGFPTFEKYCVGRWKFNDRRARQLIDAAKVTQQLDDNTGTAVPVSTERQARELAPLVEDDPETARAVWREVNEEHPGNVTAPRIREAVARVRRVVEPEYIDAEYVQEPDPRIPDLKAAIQLLEPLYRDYDDYFGPLIRAHAAGLRNTLRRMQAETEGI